MLQQIAVQRIRLMSQASLPTNNQLILQYLALQNQNNIPKPESSPNFSNLSSSTDDSGILRKRQISDESSTTNSENQVLSSQPKKLKIEKSELFSCDVCNALFLEKVSCVCKILIPNGDPMSFVCFQDQYTKHAEICLSRK